MERDRQLSGQDSASTLRKLYIEVTNQCNLACRTCVRNTWHQETGRMSEELFSKTLEGLGAFANKPTIFFGGFGEPLSHPDIVTMVRRAKAYAPRVELITNGTLLTPELSRELIFAGLDLLWVSIDGASPESYADIRLGAELPGVIRNVTAFHEILQNQFGSNNCGAVPLFRTGIGVVFVAMRRNIADLPAVLEIAQGFGASDVLITNFLPYSRELREEILYGMTISRAPKPALFPHVRLPLMDLTDATTDPLLSALHYGRSIRAGAHELNDEKNHCRFIADGVGAVSWNGNFSPCLPLMYDHETFYGERKRVSKRWAVGNIKDSSLKQLWELPEHLAFRRRVHDFDFAPCTYCGGCDLADDNEQDCQGNEFPTCGGCLWAQGVIQCP